LWRGANADSLGKTFSVDATEQLDGDVDVSIGCARYDRRGKVVALNYSESVASPAKPDTDPGLGRESHFVGVDSDQQEYIGVAGTRAAHPERRGAGACSRNGIARAAGGIGRSDVSTGAAVIGQQRGATRVRVGGCRCLRSRRIRSGENAPTPVHQTSVRF
jgi:hypothetical protein